MLWHRRHLVVECHDAVGSAGLLQALQGGERLARRHAHCSDHAARLGTARAATHMAAAQRQRWRQLADLQDACAQIPAPCTALLPPHTPHLT